MPIHPWSQLKRLNAILHIASLTFMHIFFRQFFRQYSTIIYADRHTTHGTLHSSAHATDGVCHTKEMLLFTSYVRTFFFSYIETRSVSEWVNERMFVCNKLYSSLPGSLAGFDCSCSSSKTRQRRKLVFVFDLYLHPFCHHSRVWSWFSAHCDSGFVC